MMFPTRTQHNASVGADDLGRPRKTHIVYYGAPSRRPLQHSRAHQLFIIHFSLCIYFRAAPYKSKITFAEDDARIVPYNEESSHGRENTKHNNCTKQKGSP